MCCGATASKFFSAVLETKKVIKAEAKSKTGSSKKDYFLHMYDIEHLRYLVIYSSFGAQKVRMTFNCLSYKCRYEWMKWAISVFQCFWQITSKYLKFY